MGIKGVETVAREKRNLEYAIQQLGLAVVSLQLAHQKRMSQDAEAIRLRTIRVLDRLSDYDHEYRFKHGKRKPKIKIEKEEVKPTPI